MRLWVPLVGSAFAVTAAGFAASSFAYWSVYDGMLAEDDFWDRCRSSAMLGELAPGRYESVVWSKENGDGVCEEVRGYCIVNSREDGTVFGESLRDHQISMVSSKPADCTFAGWLFAERSPWKRTN